MEICPEKCVSAFEKNLWIFSKSVNADIFFVILILRENTKELWSKNRVAMCNIIEMLFHEN